MLYNIYHENALGGRGRFTAIEKVLVDKLVDAFLRGSNEVRFQGDTFHFGTYCFHIYEIPIGLGNDAKKIRDIFNQYENEVHRGNFQEEVFSDYCKDVTSEFLRGFEFGELVDYFNIYVNNGDRKNYFTVLNRSEIDKFLASWANAESPTWVDNREISFNKPQAIKIFDIKSEYLSRYRGDIKEFQRKTVGILFKGEWTINALEYFGKDVSSDFKIDPYGSKARGDAIKAPNRMSTPKLDGRIFISHSSKDKELVSHFIEMILILGIGIKREDIFCTSDRGTDIKSGEDFKRVIKDELDGARAVIQIITKNYKTSEVCLNEMGAAWVISEKVIPLVAFPFNYDTGFIHASSQQLILNNKQHLLKFYDDHKKDLFSRDVNFTVLDQQVNKFVDFVNRIRLEDNIERRFFYDEEVSIKGKLLGDIFQHPNESHHRFYFVLLNESVDVLSNEMAVEEGSFNTSRFGIEAIQVGAAYQVEIDFKKYLNEDVIVTGVCFGGHTAWHQTPVVMLVNSIVVAK